MLSLKGSHSRLPLSILIAGILVACFGLVAIYDASVVDAFRTFGDKFHYVKQRLAPISLVPIPGMRTMTIKKRVNP